MKPTCVSAAACSRLWSALRGSQNLTSLSLLSRLHWKQRPFGQIQRSRWLIGEAREKLLARVVMVFQWMSWGCVASYHTLSEHLLCAEELAELSPINHSNQLIIKCIYEILTVTSGDITVSNWERNSFGLPSRSAIPSPRNVSTCARADSAAPIVVQRSTGGAANRSTPSLHQRLA